MLTDVSDPQVQTEGEGHQSELVEYTQCSSHIRRQFRKEISKMSQLLCAVRHRNISEESEQSSPPHGHFMSEEKTCQACLLNSVKHMVVKYGSKSSNDYVCSLRRERLACFSQPR